ncbi:MAG: ABC transporter ATP-binding protein/permease [Micavibrio aeruginosavorus]|uniref:ABC transporter ATP-binding protein/permease n=1 Tax=Micavibrio aeruginosavorus TaxID=349221 RepID=A0A7T5R4F7_9BACT|nr:MAG: ABC transporter ATP-binding protein/permease [Micavibrio aeruginosavorus]
MFNFKDGLRRAFGGASGNSGKPANNLNDEQRKKLMNSTVLSSPSESMRAAWQLAKPYFTRSEEKRKAKVMLAMVLGLTIGQVYMDVKLSNWGNGFYKTLQQAGNVLEKPETTEVKAQIEQLKDKTTRQLFEFLGLAGIFLALAITKVKINQKLQLNWRQWMTNQYASNWIDGDHKTYYRMLGDGSAADNPDQRISEDIARFTGSTLGLGTGFLRSSLSLPSFTYILWDIAGPAFVAGAAGYAVASTYLAHKIGKPLIKLNQDQQKYEADFRYGLVNVRNNTESIALQDGEAVERDILKHLFGPVVSNQNRIINKNMQMTALSAVVNQTANVAPYIIMLPQFFGRKMDLGDFFQGASAFGQVQGDLSWFFNAYTDLADWKSVTNRLTGFSASMQKHNGTAASMKPSAPNAG